MAKDSVQAKAAAAAANRSKKKSGKSQTGYYIAIGAVTGITLGAVLLAVINSPASQRRRPTSVLDTLVNDKSLINEVNRKDNFTGAASPFFDRWTLADMYYGFDGAKVNSMGFAGMAGAIQFCPTDDDDAGIVPINYDPRTKHPSCFGDVYDSGNCTSSYAIAAATSLSMRYCLEDEEVYKGVRLSPQQILSCDKKSKGCSGGGIDTVWSYVARRGLYPETCLPYAGKKGAACKTSCEESQKKKAMSFCIIRDATKKIKREILERGPVVAPMNLMSDFLVYSGGIYSPLDSATVVRGSEGKPVQHAVTIIGWGKDSGIPYWLIQNSFGTKWGEEGYAKVAIDEVLMENYLIAGTPETPANVERAEKAKAQEEERKAQAKKEREERDARIEAARKARAEAQAAQMEDFEDEEDFELEDDMSADEEDTEM